MELIMEVGFNMEEDFNMGDFKHSFPKIKHFPALIHFNNQINW